MNHEKNPSNGHIDARLTRLFKKARAVSLSFSEREAAFAVIQARIARSPLPTSPTLSPGYRLQASSFFSFISDRRGIVLALVGGLILLSGNGIASAAQNALPGDFLYPWKIGVNEKIVSSLAGSPQAQAEIQTVQAATRLTELEKLAIENKLTPALQQQAEDNFNAHADNAIADIQTIGQRGDTIGAAEAGNDLESALSAHRDIIADMPSDLQTVERNVTNALITAVQVRTQAEYSLATSSDPGAVKLAAESIRDVSLAALTNARNSLDMQSLGNTPPNGAPASDAAVADDQVNQAEKYQSQGSSKLDSGSYGDAIMLFGQANRRAETAAIKIKILHDIGLPTIAPVSTPTPIEPISASNTATTTATTTSFLSPEQQAAAVAAATASTTTIDMIPSASPTTAVTKYQTGRPSRTPHYDVPSGQAKRSGDH